MGSTWGPPGPTRPSWAHIGPMNLAIWDVYTQRNVCDLQYVLHWKDQFDKFFIITEVSASILIPPTHYGDIIMGAISSQITSLTIVYSTVYSDADQRKHQSSTSLAFVWGIHRGPVNSPHKWPVTRKMFPFDDVVMKLLHSHAMIHLVNPQLIFMLKHGWRFATNFYIEWITSISLNLHISYVPMSNISNVNMTQHELIHT